MIYATWGHRSAVSTRAAGSFYGYKMHAAVCTATGLPLAWRIETAKRQESLYLAPLIDTLHARGFKPETVAADTGYDNTRVFAECEQRGVEPVILLRGARKQGALPRPTDEQARRPRASQRSLWNRDGPDAGGSAEVLGPYDSTILDDWPDQPSPCGRQRGDGASPGVDAPDRSTGREHDAAAGG
jgi:hypothetical protein